MYGYIFEVANSINDKKFIDFHRSVKFDPKYFGSNPALLSEMGKYGIDKFTAKMLIPCESEEALMNMYSHYNTNNEVESVEEQEEVKSKRTRKKKAETE